MSLREYLSREFDSAAPTLEQKWRDQYEESLHEAEDLILSGRADLVRELEPRAMFTRRQAEIAREAMTEFDREERFVLEVPRDCKSADVGQKIKQFYETHGYEFRELPWYKDLPLESPGSGHYIKEDMYVNVHTTLFPGELHATVDKAKRCRKK